MENERRFAKRFLLWQIPLFLFAVLYGAAFVFAEERGLSLFSCRIRENLGLYCLGCGGSRAVLCMLRLRFISAFRLYPPVPIAALCLLVADIFALRTLLFGKKMPTRRFGIAVLILCLTAVILQCIVKNALLLQGIDILGDILK